MEGIFIEILHEQLRNNMKVIFIIFENHSD